MLLRNLVLSALVDGEKRTLAGISKKVSDALCLGRVVQPSYIAEALSELDRNSHVATDGRLYKITDLGKQSLKNELAAEKIAINQGKTLLLEAISQSSGHAITDEDGDKIWKVVQDGLSSLLYLHGVQTINALSAIVNQKERGISGQIDLAEKIKKIGDKVIMALSASPMRAPKSKKGAKAANVKVGAQITTVIPVAMDIGQAVIDAFHNTTTPVFEWFTKLCACYTAICSLGLSESTQLALIDKLKNMSLFFDTDIVLSWLAEGEPDHEKIKSLVDGWSKVGGEIFVAMPVMEELAYHASISELDFREVFHQLNSYDEIDSIRLITNAFVRGYWATCKRMGKPFSFATWRQYIANFKGNSESDFSRIAADLKVNRFVPVEKELVDESLAKYVAESVSKLKSAGGTTSNPDVLAKRFDKNRRDGRFVAHVSQFRKQDDHRGKVAIIVSSSPLLSKVCRDLSVSQGIYPLVLPLGSLAYLLTLVPGTHLSLFGLQRLLFDTKFHEYISPVSRIALRLLQNSEQYTLPFSRRANLDREMMIQIGIMADQRGEAPSKTQRYLSEKTQESNELLVEIVRESIDKVAMSEAEKEIQRLREEIRHLKRNQGLI